MMQPETPPADFLMTVRQVAEMFQVTEWTVRNWINGRSGQPGQGVLKAVKRGKGWRVWHSDAVAYGKVKYDIK